MWKLLSQNRIEFIEAFGLIIAKVACGLLVLAREHVKDATTKVAMSTDWQAFTESWIILAQNSLNSMAKSWVTQLHKRKSFHQIFC